MRLIMSRSIPFPHRSPPSFRRAFTMVELMIAVTILAIFLFFAYRLFLGGTATANKGNWINATVGELRNTTALLTKEIKSTSYPTTLFANMILDPCDNPDANVAKQFYLKIRAENQEIKAPDSGELEVMRWVSCEPEHPPNPGKITYNSLWFKANPTATRVKVGDIVHKTEAFTFTTAANSSPNSNHARSGNLAKSPLPNGKKEHTILRDVELIHFTVPESLPTTATNFAPINIRLRTWFPQDSRVFKENSIMVTPNVGISLF
jgi:prepilin-type N-terminal cleavage/methylation domain-containing protein